MQQFCNPKNNHFKMNLTCQTKLYGKKHCKCFLFSKRALKKLLLILSGLGNIVRIILCRIDERNAELCWLHKQIHIVEPLMLMLSNYVTASETSMEEV